MNSFGKRNLVKFFSFLGEGGGEGVFFVFLPCFRCVLIMFPKDSQVPNVFPNPLPKILPIAPHIYPIWFAQSSTLMYINRKGEL